MNTADTKKKRKLRLTKKQFIIAIIAVCSIALLVEGGLVVHMFTKKYVQRSKETSQKERRIKSKTEKRYDFGTEEGKTWIKSVTTVSEYYDEEGRVTYKTTCEDDYDSDGRYTYTKTDDERYYYDKKGRIVKEEWKEHQSFFGSEEWHRDPWETKETYKWVYGYGNNPAKMVAVKIDGKGRICGRKEERYNSRGLLVFNQSMSVGHFSPDGKPGDIRDMVQISEYDESDRRINLDHYNYYGPSEQEEDYDVYEDGTHYPWIYGWEGNIVHISSCGCGYTMFELDEMGRYVRKENVTGHGDGRDYNIYYYYSDSDSKCIETCKIYRFVYNEEAGDYIDGDLLAEMEFDSRGRIIREVWYKEEGTETRLSDWDYEDPALPGKKVLRMERYAGNVKESPSEGRLLSDYRYMIELEKTVAGPRYGMPDPDCFDFFGWENWSGNYVETDGTWTVNEYSKKDYDEESGTWKTIVESGFDESGNWTSKTEYGRGYIYYTEFDEYGKRTRYKREHNGKLDYLLECEYTYY